MRLSTDAVLIRARDTRSNISSTALVSLILTRVASAQYDEYLPIRFRVPVALFVAIVQ